MQQKKITLIDYGIGNLQSVASAFQYLGNETIRTSDKQKIKNADYLVLAGVGSFPSAKEKINYLDLQEVIKSKALTGTPILGICLGMQLLFGTSEEEKETKGLNLLKGKVRYLNTDLKLPHIGWNIINWQKEGLLNKNMKNQAFYHLHSLAPQEVEDKNILATTNYPNSFISAVEKDNLFGVQFHPEKSGKDGLQLLDNFINCK